MAKKSAEEGSADKDLDAICKVSICCMKCELEAEHEELLDRVLTGHPRANDIGAGRVKLSAVPVDFQDLWRFGTTDDTKLRDRKSAPLCCGYLLIDRVSFEHTARLMHSGRGVALLSAHSIQGS